MNFRNISAWSIRNPVVPIVLFLGLTLAGIVAFSGMKIQQDPDIEFPMVIVSVSQPGAAPTEIETQITQRIESSVRTISGVRSLSSTASESNSQTMVEFQIGTDINAAVNEVKNSVDQVRGELPDGILEPQVFKVQTSSDPIAYFAVAADDMTIEQLSWFIDDTIAKRLLAIPGMANVERGGGVDREIVVELNPARMQALGVTANQVNAVLRQVNINAAGGKAEVAGSRQSVRVLGNAEDAYELSQTQIALPGGRTVKLADFATVTDRYGELTAKGKVKNREVVTFGISRARGESDVSVYDATVEELEKISEENNGQVRFTRLFTSVDYTIGQYESSIAAMIEGAILAVIVVFFFLRDWRATVVSALAIPLSAIPTFWFMDLMGFSLNTLSLLALGLVAGVLVDDAIVEIENIVRHMRMGKSAYQASIDAADEIGLPVVATTFSIVAVFLPVGLMPGVSGQFFKNFGLTVVAAVLMSLAVARMITPMVAAYFLKAHGHADHASGPMMDRYLRILAWSLDKSKAQRYREGRGGLRRWMSLFLDHRMWMMGVGFAALLITGVLFTMIPMQFFPDSNSDFSRVSIEMVPGTTLEQTERVADRVAEIINEQPEVETALERIREGQAYIFITLRDDRERTSMEFERELTPILQQVPDARVNFLSNQGGGGTGRDISVMLSGSDPDELNKTAATLVEQMRTLDTVVAPRLNADLRRPELVIEPRLDLAAQLGITTAALSQTIRIATQGEIDQNSAKFSLSDRQVPIRVKLPEDSRRNIETLRNLPVPTANGGSVPLERVAEIRFGSGPTQIQRYNQSRRVFVGADLAPGVVKGTADEQIQNLPIMKNLPQGVSNAPFGADEWQAEMLNNFFIALAAGIMLVFSVLVLLYHRFVSPLVNMGSLFLAPLGGLIALLITGQSLSLPVFIGVLMLFGIVAKNSILLIDFAIEEMATGRSKFEAIVEAGHKRAQPIIMTTVAMTAGMVPTAISLSGDAAWRAPMGTVVIGGLIMSTVLTLLIVPAGFSLADGLEKRIGPKLRKSVLTFEPEHAEDDRRRSQSDTAYPAE
ncbi:multidrug transporter AcrB [Novosphingobium marinum]|uniref:Multidrug efflux pump subunit AcrB n=1 Tax=Novosphingobium marinum TaxID=1514948 RepID=A0A7Y9XZ17_9SPHN|nr:efflux RND transporter permease subunit [Novosphingobium marinum]NYH95713.1 multidrug efflux pump subunit AcrB [Novosphingobium marinum]GGC29279.1 multidrug transporter AcrB [Novosphingobium marinum]